jgi:REP element-mobilizing transposase RayT
MARSSRRTIHEQEGGYHIVSRIVGQQFLMDSEGKDYFVKVLHHLCRVYFVNLHAYCIMDNHFHVLITMNTEGSLTSSVEDLLSRVNHHRSFKNLQLLPVLDKKEIPKLRERFGSISRFVQELKQEYSRWFNRKYKRTGYLWGDRFKGVLVSHGKAQLACAAYIEMNPVRARLVTSPEQYPWSSSAFISKDRETSKDLLTPVHLMQEQGEAFSEYKDFLRSILKQEQEDSKNVLSEFGLQGLDVVQRNPSFSQGCVIGSSLLVDSFRENEGRKEKDVPMLFGIPGLGVTRVLSKGYGTPDS